MKTTLDLPDDLMRAVKVHAAENKQRLDEAVANALRAALSAPVAMRPSPAVERRPAAAASPAIPAEPTAAQRRQRFAALLTQLDQVPDLPQALEALAWDDQGLPR